MAPEKNETLEAVYRTPAMKTAPTATTAPRTPPKLLLTPSIPSLATGEVVAGGGTPVPEAIVVVVFAGAVPMGAGAVPVGRVTVVL
jgi:hypothetical protein